MGIDLEAEVANLVSLDKDWHKKNTLGIQYYQRIVRNFKNADTPYEFRRKMDRLADYLLKESGKVP